MQDTNAAILNANLLMIHASFPRIGKALELYWGEKEFSKYVNSLLADNTHLRQGFPAHVLSSIMILQDLHDKLFPQLMIDDPDNWMSSQFGIE